MPNSFSSKIFSSAIRGIHKEMGLHPVKLTFRNNLEKEYRKYKFKHSVDFLRITLLFSIVFYLSFNLLDYIIFPEKHLFFLAIRVIICFPIALTVYFLSFVTFFKKYWQPIMVLLVLTAGTGILIMLANGYEKFQQGYYAGLFLVVFFNYIFTRLSFLWASLSGWILFAMYLITILIYSSLPSREIFMNAFFLASANFFGMAGSYLYEYQLRREFFTIQLLKKEKSNVDFLNINLENKVKERTGELESLNRELEKNNTKLQETQKELSIHKTNLEETVEKRTRELQEKVEELERYNQLFVGREFRIKELKDRIKELEKRLKPG